MYHRFRKLVQYHVKLNTHNKILLKVGWVEATKPNKYKSWCWVSLPFNPTYFLIAEYSHTGLLAVSGDYYLVATTGGVYEFIYTDNNRIVSDAVAVTLTPPPDLQVTEITAPEAMEAGQNLDLFWRVSNTGTGEATGTWIDSVELQPAGGGGAISLGSFTYQGTLAPGQSYARVEQLTVPSTLQGLYQVALKTNSSASLYEHGAGITIPPMAPMRLKLLPLLLLTVMGQLLVLPLS